ncbi:MAG: peptide chain release factor-like protein [Acidobacteria bacterium]|nr:peptide chain release factor-like protein [Acidobacteriota bacterium]
MMEIGSDSRKKGIARKGPSEAELAALRRDCRVTYYRASGPGGQHRNKTSTAVRLQHLPTGILDTAADTRSQHRNRLNALIRLWMRLRALARKRKPRKKTRISRAARTRNLAAKKKQSWKKTLRKKPSREEE